MRTRDLGVEVVTVLDAPLVVDARYRTNKRDWDAAVPTVLRGCSVQPYQAVEATTDREWTSTHMRLFTPYGPHPHATSRVVHEGVTYEVDGEPGRWRDARGDGHHVEAVLKRLDG